MLAFKSVLSSIPSSSFLFFSVFYIICFFFQDAGFVPNGNMNAPISEGINGGEVERRLTQFVSAYSEYCGFCHILYIANKMRLFIWYILGFVKSPVRIIFQLLLLFLWVTQ